MSTVTGLPGPADSPFARSDGTCQIAGAKSITVRGTQVNTNPSVLNNKKDPMLLSAGPRRLDENPMLLGEVARRRCHDSALADYNFASLPDCLAHVVFADEVRNFFTATGQICRGPRFRRRPPCGFAGGLRQDFGCGAVSAGAAGYRLGSASGSYVASRGEEFIDPARKRRGGDPAGHPRRSGGSRQRTSPAGSRRLASNREGVRFVREPFDVQEMHR